VPDITILLLGNTDRSEFRQARDAMDRWGRVVGFAGPEEAEAALGQRRLVPDVIVIAQSHPAQFSHEAIDRLRRLAPLARVLALLGSWCEGEMRTGQPWPGVVRTYWHQWLPRGVQQFDRLRRGARCAWALPPTATEEERLLLAAEEPVANRRGLIGIWTHSFEMADWLSATCRSCGLATVWLRGPRPARIAGPTAVLFDGSDGRDGELREIERLSTSLAPAPLIALLDFPRIEAYRRVLAAGAAAVVSKPFHVEDLFWELDRVTAS